MIKTHESVVIEIERALKKAIEQLQQFGILLTVHPELDKYMQKEGDKAYFEKFAKKLKAKLEFAVSDALHLNDYQVFSTVTKEILDV